MKKLLLSAVICSILLWSCEKHPGDPSKGYTKVDNDKAKQMIYHLKDSGVVTNIYSIVQGTPFSREDFLWALKNKKTDRVFFLMAAYLPADTAGMKYKTTMLAQIRVVIDDKATYTYYDLRMPISRPVAKEKEICPEPTPCDVETYVVEN